METLIGLFDMEYTVKTNESLEILMSQEQTELLRWHKSSIWWLAASLWIGAQINDDLWISEQPDGTGMYTEFETAVISSTDELILLAE